MMPGYWPGPSGQATKLGIWPYLVVTMTSCSIMAGVSGFGKAGAPSLARMAPHVTRFCRDGGVQMRLNASPTPRRWPVPPDSLPRERGRARVGALRGLDIAVAGVTVVMMRVASFAFLLSIGLVSTAVAQTATPTTGNVGSAALRNGFPAGGGAVALPSVQNSSGTTSTSTSGTTTTTSTTGTTGTGGSNSTGSGASGQTGGGGGSRG